LLSATYFFYKPFFKRWLLKAVYNNNNLGSIANDSIHIYQIAININEQSKNDFELIKNPVKAGENIGLFFPKVTSDNCR